MGDGERNLYSAGVRLRSPLWLLAAMYRWMIVNDRYIHRRRLEGAATDEPLRYRLRIDTPAWAMSVCKAVAEESSAPTRFMVHRLEGTFGALAMTGDLRVGDKPIVRTTVRYSDDGQSVVCRFAGYTLPGRYQGLLSNMSSHMERMITVHQKRVDDRVRAAGLLAYIAARLAIAR
jgi:hypothetical protein